MVLLFGFVFGSAITVPGGGNYREYLMPGLFGMITITGVAATAMGIATDLARGVTDRFRSLPMARSAVPFGQTAADLLTGAFGLGSMALCGLAVGWRAHGGSPGRAADAAPLRRGLGGDGARPHAPQAGVGRRPGAAELFRGDARQQLRAHRRHAGLAAPGRRVEPGQRRGRGLPQAVRQPRRRDWGRLAAAPPGAGHRRWSVLLLVVFVPLATRLYHRAGD